MTTLPEPKRLKDLIKLLHVLRGLQEELLTVVQGRIDAMKRADIAGLSTLGGRELAIVKRIQEREGLRRQLMDAIGDELGLPSGTARTMTISQLAARVSPDAHDALRKAADDLRDVAMRTAQSNRIAGVVAREILLHMKWVFAAVRPKDAPPVGYAGDGALVGRSDSRIFETVG